MDVDSTRTRSPAVCRPQLTYPLDIIRFRMAVDPTLNTIPQVRSQPHSQRLRLT